MIFSRIVGKPCVVALARPCPRLLWCGKQGRSRRELDAASKTNETQTRISVPRRDDGDDTPIISNHSPSNQQMHSIANGRCFCERRSCGCCRRRGEVASSNNVATPLRFIATSLRIIAASLLVRLSPRTGRCATRPEERIN